MSLMSSLTKSTGSLDSHSPSPTSSVCSDASRNGGHYQVISNTATIIQLNFENLDIFYSDHDDDYEDDESIACQYNSDGGPVSHENWELIDMNESESDENKTLINPDNDKSPGKLFLLIDSTNDDIWFTPFCLLDYELNTLQYVFVL